MIPITVRYRKSSEKWKGIREFAEANDIDTTKIDAMISRIKIKGDAELKFEEVFRITDLNDLFDSIHGVITPHARTVPFIRAMNVRWMVTQIVAVNGPQLENNSCR